MNLMIIVRGDKTGLGYQTRNLVRMLDPKRIFYIDSTAFNGNEQHYEWYKGKDGFFVKGFPTDSQCMKALQNVTHLLTCETAYNYNILRYARMKGIKTFIQTNWEFLDYKHQTRLPLPSRFIMPSHWHVDDMKQQYDNVVYLPPPTYPEDFAEVTLQNTTNAGNKFIHIIGTKASEDRNGTESLLNSLVHTKSDFDLTIKAQHDIEINRRDLRVRLDFTDLQDQQDLYRDYDVLILPRRYGGLCLPMNEALTCGMPVFMPDISPNNKVLPKKWLFKVKTAGNFMAKQNIELHDALPESIAEKIDWWCSLTKKQKLAEKQLAVEISQQYHPENLSNGYAKLW